MMTSLPYHSLIPQDAQLVHDSIRNAHLSASAIDRTAYATAAMALALLNTPLYLLQGIFTCDVEALENCGKSLLFIAATVVKIFAAFCQENAFMPPPVNEKDAHPDPVTPPTTPPPDQRRVSFHTPSNTLIEPPPLPPETPVLPPPVAAPVAPVLHLLTEENKSDIRRMMTMIGEKRSMRLLKVFSNQRELEALGDKIRPIPPLQFLHFIWTDPPMRTSLISLREEKINFLIWSNFKKNLSENLEKVRHDSLIHSYIAALSKTLHLDATQVRHYIKPPQQPIVDPSAIKRYNETHKCDVEGLVDYLIRLTAKK